MLLLRLNKVLLLNVNNDLFKLPTYHKMLNENMSCRYKTFI